VLKFSACLREVVFNRLLTLFSHYDKFVIYPSQCDLDSWLTNREMVNNFDKEAFLGDQPDIYLSFLCPFLGKFKSSQDLVHLLLRSPLAVVFFSTKEWVLPGSPLV